VASQLVQNRLAVYALDLHGRGQSDGERFYVEKINDYVEDVDVGKERVIDDIQAWINARLSA